jgi:hypothetical protein
MLIGRFLPKLPLRPGRAVSRWLVLFPALLSFLLSSAQNISGVVNSYYRVIEVVPAKTCVRLNTTAGLSYGDRAMLIQMKGATINTNNTSVFGDTLSLNNAGNYEMQTICNIIGDSVFFVYTILNQYTVADKVQLVRVPQYANAMVVDTLKAAPWNNTTGTGGVLAIYVQQDLVLNAPISADTNGYRGGAYRVSSGTCIGAATSFYYNANNLSPQSGSFKGEGAAEVAATQSGGKGAPANGGGGGNNHNNGGGGGANLTAGGDGGGNSSTTGCTGSNAGRPGKALTSHGGKKIFMGGGGGAGHVNNNLAVSNGGGHGGGIIFIHANNLTGNGRKISANGQNGGPAASDGASGAGAAGTIIMDVNNYTGSTTVEANGGAGGAEADGLNIGRCYGAGGGGGGGVVYFSGTTPAIPVTVTGGAAGVESDRDASCAAIVPTSAGATGQLIQNYAYRRASVLPAGFCSTLLPVELTWFNARYANGQTLLYWQAPQPELIDRFSVERSVPGGTWTAIDEKIALAGNTSYHADDLSPKAGHNLYRIKIIKKNNAVVYSTVQKVYVPETNRSITIYPNPARHKITITGASSGSLLTLSDITGKQVWQKKIIASQGVVEMDLPSIATGVYIIKLEGIIKQLVVR